MQYYLCGADNFFKLDSSGNVFYKNNKKIFYYLNLYIDAELILIYFYLRC